MLDNPISWSRKCVLALTASMVMTVGACITISAPVTQTSDQARLLDEFSQLYGGDALFSKDNVGTILHVEFSEGEVLISPTELNSGFKIDRSGNPEIASGYYLSGQEGSEGFAALIFTLDHSKNVCHPSWSRLRFQES